MHTEKCLLYCLLLFSDDNRGWMLNIIACPFAAAVEACGRNIKLNGSVECSKAEAHLVKMNMPTHQVNLLRQNQYIHVAAQVVSFRTLAAAATSQRCNSRGCELEAFSTDTMMANFIL